MRRLLCVLVFLAPVLGLPLGCSQISDICEKVNDCSGSLESERKDRCAGVLEDAEARAAAAGCEPQYHNVLDCLEESYKCGEQMPALGTCEVGFGIDCETTSVGISCQAQNAGFEACLDSVD